MKLIIDLCKSKINQNTSLPGLNSGFESLSTNQLTVSKLLKGKY